MKTEKLQSPIPFNTIEFSSENKTITLKDADGKCVKSQDISQKAVKLTVVKATVIENGNKFKTLYETGNINTLTTQKLELKVDFKGTNANADLLFGILTHSFTTSINNKTIGVSGKFHALWIGSDDIRNNFIEEENLIVNKANLLASPPPSGLLLMENNTLSFEIVTNNGQEALIMRYH